MMSYLVREYWSMAGRVERDKGRIDKSVPPAAFMVQANYESTYCGTHREPSCNLIAGHVAALSNVACSDIV